MHFADEYARMGDPLPWLYRETVNSPNRAHVGMTPQGWLLTPPETSLLVLGPPRSNGKTAGTVLPAVMTAPGPTLLYTTKVTPMRETLVARLRLGRCFHLTLTEDETPPGAVQAGWNPIVGCEDAKVAVLTAGRFVSVLKQESASNGSQHFQKMSGKLLAVLFHAAALFEDNSMRWVMRTLLQQDIEVLKQLSVMLAGRKGSADLGNVLRLILLTDHRERSSFFTTAANAMDPFMFEAALEATERPVMIDPASFVAGQPQLDNPDLRLVDQNSYLGRMGASYKNAPGRFDTIYVTANSEDQQALMGYFVAFMAAISSAIKKQHKADEAAGYLGRRPVTSVYDELFGMAADPNLPANLADSGGQGHVIVGCLQDLSQAAERWGRDIARGFLTLWQNVSVLPGIRDKETLETISTLSGEYDRPVAGSSWGGTNGMIHSISNHRQPRLPADRISQGRLDAPDAFVHLPHGGGYAWVYNTPYYRSNPWPSLLVGCMEWAADKRLAVPVPDLARFGDGHLASAHSSLPERFRLARKHLEAL